MYLHRILRFFHFIVICPSDGGQLIYITVLYFKLGFYSNVNAHIFHILLNKYAGHISNMSHTTIMLNRHIDLTLLYACAKRQPTAASTSHATAIFVLETIPFKCHIYQVVHSQIWENYVSLHASYELTSINNMTMSTGIHTYHITGICIWRNTPATLHISANIKH